VTSGGYELMCGWIGVGMLIVGAVIGGGWSRLAWVAALVMPHCRRNEQSPRNVSV
jgi:hypothetical protein